MQSYRCCNKIIFSISIKLCLAIKGDLESVNIRFKIRYKVKSNKHQTKDIYHTVESYTPDVWNHICVNMYDLVSADSELSQARKAGSSVHIKLISISRPLYVDDVWIGRVPLTGMTITSFKGKWQQKILLSHLKGTLKQYIEVYYKIFIFVSLREIFSPKSTNCPPSWINF